jgi:hypothetical protein
MRGAQLLQTKWKGNYIMKNLRAILVVSGALVAATSFYGSAANAQSASMQSCMAGGLSQADCACEIALEKGTKQAIRAFLRNYSGRGTACEATAFTGPANGNINDNSSSNRSTTRPSRSPESPDEHECNYDKKYSS